MVSERDKRFDYFKDAVFVANSKSTVLVRDAEKVFQLALA
jgi:hypothetical protein